MKLVTSYFEKPEPQSGGVVYLRHKYILKSTSILNLHMEKNKLFRKMVGCTLNKGFVTAINKPMWLSGERMRFETCGPSSLRDLDVFVNVSQEKSELL